MRLVLQDDDVDLVASLISNASDIKWFVETLGLELAGTADSLPAALRNAGAKRMRLSKTDEQLLGAFVRGETYTDGVFKHHFLFFERAVALLASKEATCSTMLAYLQCVGLSEKKFEERPVYFLEILGYRPDADEVTLEEAGLDKSLKALHGKPEWVRLYRLGNLVLGVARFKQVTHIHFGNEQQLKDIYRELGITYSLDRFKRHIDLLLGSGSGLLRVVLLNGADLTMPVNRDSPDWAEKLHALCEMIGGGAVKIER